MVSSRASRTELPEGRATSVVHQAEIAERLPRSAPDALRYEPGVFVQQTAHGQGSAFIRGLTGQQTLLLFDGIRLNNSTYRQGPNQYFFTLDSRSIASLEVLRGGGSTRFGSDALGGVILAHPVEPPVGSPGETWARPGIALRGGTADHEIGGRLRLDGVLGQKLGLVAGVGARDVGLLRAGGPIYNPSNGEPALVPRFAPDGKTQLGTGFKELTFDARLTYRPTPAHALTAAAYLYRQYDAPRTDQCPPPYASFDECLRYEEQFRTLVYAAYSGRLGSAAERLRATVSWQNQHERRRGDRPSSFTCNLGRDDVDTFGVTLQARTRRFQPARSLRLRLRYGADTYVDRVTSRAWVGFSDIDHITQLSRGQYLDGSRYVYGGLFAEGEAELWRRLTLRAGGRVSWIAASAPGDPDSGSAPVDRAWTPVVGNAGVEWRALRWLGVHANVDRSFRAPNLDDLTSRQQTGPGFQFENAALDPERATTLEGGFRLRTWPVVADVWLFRTFITGAIGREPRDASQCPPGTPQCNASWARFRLVNARETAFIHGVELAARLRLPLNLAARVTLSWTFGEGPNLAEPPADPRVPYEARVPLSRIPPLNGTAELRWFHRSGFTAGAGLRWATAQDRLAVADRSDARIPFGGTPGFAVVDLRAAWRHRFQGGTALIVAVVAENLLDTAYRYHGSSVNGPGRGAMFNIEVKP